jgi:hypothetical protein
MCRRTVAQILRSEWPIEFAHRPVTHVPIGPIEAEGEAVVDHLCTEAEPLSTYYRGPKDRLPSISVICPTIEYQYLEKI